MSAMKFSGIGAIVLMALSLVACSGEQNRYSEYCYLPDDGWRYDDVLEFQPVHTDSLCEGSFVIGVRHDSSYPYTELMLEVEYETIGRERHDTLQLQLADRYGNWTGRGIGMSFQCTDTLPMVVHPSATALKVRHLMRMDTLHGVNQLGVFFVPKND